MSDRQSISHSEILNAYSHGETEESEVPEDCSANFSKRIREMFPDVDASYIAHECRSLHTEEDCARFINDVMLIGDYPKERPVWRSPTVAIMDDELQIPDYAFPEPLVYSSDEEIRFHEIIKAGFSYVKIDDALAIGTPPPESPTSNKETVNKDSFELKESKEGREISKSTGGGNFSMDSFGRGGRGSEVKSDCATAQVAHSPRQSDIQEKLPSASCGAAGQNTNSKNSKTCLTNSEVGRNNPELGKEEEDPSTAEDWIDNQTEDLVRLFPNTDPTFLREECAKLKGSLEAMYEFVTSKLEKNDMPSREAYEKQQVMNELQRRYTKNFSVEDFLRDIPHPWSYFGNSDRNCAKYKAHSLIFLENSFGSTNSRDITNVMMENNFNLYLSYKELKLKNATECKANADRYWNMPKPTNIYIQFLQEVAFIENEEKIRDFVRAREDAEQLRLEQAKRRGAVVLECKCCYEPEIAIEDIVYCPADHSFCKSCLVKYVETEMAEARYEFPCLAGCKQKFTLSTLQSALDADIISKIVEAKQVEELEAAQIEDLVRCPFCSYAAILPLEDKVLSCLNPECLKKTCKLCKEMCHIPLRCDEVERPEEIKIRTYIENKMTEALIRKCYGCGKSFVKEDGCNKIVCKCGAKMCYVCRKPVAGYSHFNGLRGTDYKKCPLYSTNEELHVELVKKAAEKAKAEVVANSNRRPRTILPGRSKNSSHPTKRNAFTPAGFLVNKKCKRLRGAAEK